MKSEYGLETVQRAYTRYGAYINSFRAIPSVYDGLKTVQRRLLLAARDSNARTRLEHSAKIAGTCTATYNPHAETSAYDTMVRMVNADVPLFLGKGNFGSRGFNPQGSAAMRYTSAQLTTLSDVFLQDVRFVDHFTNDLGNSEPYYLPTFVPYAMLNGAQGIGQGITTHIPRINPESIYKVAKQMLEGRENEKLGYWLHPLPSGGGFIDIDEENLASLNFEGEGRCVLRAAVRHEYSEIDGKSVIVVENAPHNLSYTRLIAVLSDAMNEGLVSIRDEGDRVVVIRHNKVRRITEEGLYDTVSKAMQRTLRFRVIVSDGEKCFQIGLYDWLRTCLFEARRVYKCSIEESLHKSNLEAVFLRVRKELAMMLLKDETNVSIKSKLNLTDEELDYCMKKSIRQLSKVRNNDDAVKAEIRRLEDKLANLDKHMTQDVLKKVLI